MSKITVEFTGSLNELLTLLENNFKAGASFKLDANIVSSSEIALKLATMLHGDVRRIENALPDMIDYVKKNHKINAIKLLREVTGCPLKEAKEAVENVWGWNGEPVVKEM